MPEEAETVAYLGPKASYTHQAALQAFPSRSNALLPQSSIGAVFTAVQSGSTTSGVVPFENSSNGAVLPTLDLFASLDSEHADVAVAGEVFVDVHHCLMGRLPDSKHPKAPIRKLAASGIRNNESLTTESRGPETSPSLSQTPASYDLSKLKTVYSHPQVWGQVRTYLTAHLPHTERIDSSSTSAAAARVASTISSSSSEAWSDEAALASGLAAELYGLDILARNVEDRGDNQTRFFVLRRRDSARDEEGPGAVRGTKTLLHFRVNSHSDPGALAEALGVFGKYGLSLTSMYTRPDPLAEEAEATEEQGSRWRYIFFVEFQADASKGEEVGKALEELKGVSRAMRVVGQWAC